MRVGGDKEEEWRRGSKKGGVRKVEEGGEGGQRHNEGEEKEGLWEKCPMGY